MIKNLLKCVLKKVGKLKINYILNWPKFQIIQKIQTGRQRCSDTEIGI